MESLVSYCSDDEESDTFSGNQDADLNHSGMDIINRQPDEDTNYDNVQMDMSEESNNNNSPDRNSSDHSGNSSDSEKSSASSSPSRSRKSSSSVDDSPERSSCEVTSSSQSNRLNEEKEKVSGLNSLKKLNQSREDLSRKRSHSRSHEFGEKERDSYKKDNRSKDRSSRHERSRDKDREREERSGGHCKDRRDSKRSGSRDRRSRSQGKDQRISPHVRDRDRHHGRSKGSSPDRKRARSRSRSPGHSYSSSSSSRSSKDSHRARSRSRERQSSSARSRSKERNDRRRSRSKDRQRSRSRDRRRTYEKKPNKLTILERLGIELRPPDSMPPVTPQQLLQRSMEQQVAQVKTSTGIELPKYYNPAAMNPMRYAEQMQKRRLLWGNKSTIQEGNNPEPKPTSNNKWEGTTFAQDQDGKMTAKFKRLMGMKDTGQASSTSTSNAPVNSNELLKKQEELFNSMEMQYEVARVATHTHRGVGLGFGTFQYPR